MVERDGNVGGVAEALEVEEVETAGAKGHA